VCLTVFFLLIILQHTDRSVWYRMTNAYGAIEKDDPQQDREKNWLGSCNDNE
jgi:hypothetical protein